LDEAVALEALATTNFLVGGFLLAIAALVFALDWKRNTNRLASLFFFVRGSYTLLGEGIVLDPESAPYWFHVRGYFAIASPFILADLFLVYNWRRSTRARMIIRWALLVSMIFIQLAYSQEHALFMDLSDGVFTFGPFAILSALVFVFGGLFGCWFSVAARRTPVKTQARFHRLLAFGFAAFAIADGTLPYAHAWKSGFADAFAPGASLYQYVTASVFLAAAPMGLLAVALLFFDPGLKSRTHRSWILGLTAFVVAMSSLASFIGPDSAGTLGTRDLAFFFLLGLARLVFPTIVGYAIVRQMAARQSLFELDYHLRVALRRGSLGGLLVGAYFAVSQIATELFQNIAAFKAFGPFWGQVLGLVSAGIVLLALHPLGKWADRLAQATIPNSESPSKMDMKERTILYQEQVELAWADGSLTRKERLLLDQLRERLSVPAGTASDIERRVLRHVQVAP
jgi:hypothetical protein